MATDPIDISSPASTSSPKQGDDAIRTLARAVIEILSVDHHVGTATDNKYNDADIGEHEQVTFNAPLEADPAPGANKGALYIKDVGGVAELFFQDEVDNPVQLTTGGKLRFASLDNVANDTYIAAVDAAGTGTADLIKASADDVPVLAAGAELAAAIDGDSEDLAIVNKSYLASEKTDLLGAGVSKDAATTYTAEASGVLVVRATITWIHNTDTYVSVLSDDNAMPTTEVARIGGTCKRGDSAQNILYLTCSVPIVKSKKYRVTATASGAVVDSITWYPNE